MQGASANETVVVVVEGGRSKTKCHNNCFLFFKFLFLLKLLEEKVIFERTRTGFKRHVRSSLFHN